MLLDHLLAFLLLVAVPARAIWRSAPTRITNELKAERYKKTIALVVGLLALLAADWLLNGRTAAMLGLAQPTTASAIIGLCIAVVVLLFLGAVSIRHAHAPKEKNAAQAELMPTTQDELRIFLILAIAVGFGWEALYRGFLLFYLEPHVGVGAAVALAAIAYGVAHGFKSKKQFFGSILSAFVFTIAYAVTANLWWLILLHMGLPCMGLLALPKRRGRGQSASQPSSNPR